MQTVLPINCENASNNARRMKWYYAAPITFVTIVSLFQVFKNVGNPGQKEKIRNSSIDEWLERKNVLFSSKQSKGYTIDERLTTSATSNQTLKIAWLMSFPNSGTTYTLEHIYYMSKNNLGTNYGSEALSRAREIIPIFDEEQSNTTGPFWMMKKSEDLYQPDEYVFTKTHCACYDWVNLRGCLRTTIADFQRRCQRNGNPAGKSYSSDHVKKAIHLIRDPFDNIISRVHHYAKADKNFEAKQNETDKEHFLRVCQEKHGFKEGKYTGQTGDTKHTKHLLSVLDSVPCRDDFFQYVFWHNMAFAMTEAMGLDSLLFHYESYDTNEEQFLKATDRMLDFLDYPRRGEPFPFGRREYIDYFTTEQRQAIKLGLKKLASTRTWNAIERYF